MTTRAAKQGANVGVVTGANIKLANTASISKGESNEGSVLSAMQQSLEQATAEMGQTGKLLASLQEDIIEIKEANVELRTDEDGIRSRLDEAEHRISVRGREQRALPISGKKC